jgi:drug/metabolite transporter superfamily protein YnfA
VAVLLVIAGAAAVVGAYLDWMWWHPTKGILITLVAIGALLLAGVLAALRRRITARIALGAVAVGAGLLLGQAVGPSREPLQGAIGSMTLRLDGPVASEVTSAADCQTEASGDQLQVSGDINGRLPLDGMDPRQYPSVSALFSAGDRWAPDSGRRDDELHVSLYLSGEIQAAGAPTELRLRSDPSSELDARLDGSSGTVEFSGLVVAEGDVEAILGVDGDVTGVLEWGCPG